MVATANVETRSASINYSLDIPRPAVGMALTFRVGGITTRETATWQDGQTAYPFNLNAYTSGDGRPVGGGPHPPHVFTGQARLNGQPATADVEIAAIISSQTVTTTHTSADGRYALKVGRQAQTNNQRVTFTINGYTATQSAIWRKGGVDLLDLNAHSGPRPTAAVFDPLITDGSLTALWRYDNVTRSWTVFDPRPEVAVSNDLTEVSPGYILWVKVSGARNFQGNRLYEGGM